MKTMLLAVALVMTTASAPGDVVCRIGTSWQGSLSEVAAIQAVWEQDAAQRGAQAYPTGAPERSLWTALVRCSKV